MGDIIKSIGAIGEGITVIRYALDALYSIPLYVGWLPVNLAALVGTICLIAFLYRILGWGD